MSNPPVPPNSSRSSAPPPKRLRKFLKWTGLLLLLLLVVAAIAGACYQAIGSASDARRFPQQGRSVPLGPDVPNVALNLDCTGQGSPTVILDSGLGVPAVGWKFVQPEVAKFTRVCSYDRAGYGWSTPGPMPRTSAQIVKELHALLAASGEKGPYILVAHSFGGYNVRIYTAQYPADVLGLVLVDTSHEDQTKYMPPTLQELWKAQAKQLATQQKLFPYLRFFGIARLGSPVDDPKLPRDFQEEMRYLQLQSMFVDATASELIHFAESATQLRAAGNLGDRPLVVLTAGKNFDAKDFPKTVSLKEMDDFHQVWINDLQVREAHLSTRGKQIIVPDSTHMIPFERPDTVIAAIREVFTTLTTPTTH